LSGLSVAVPQSIPKGERSAVKISSIGICAGSGGSMLNGQDVDLIFTGELSHHEALAAIEQGRCVITAFHSNTERAFLKDRMRPTLMQAIDGKVDIAISEVDRDPYEIIAKDAADW
jgi:putative NIF3 family GTP cyclohydrolase 1 type 2